MLTNDVVLLTMNLVTRIEVNKLVIKAIVPSKKKKKISNCQLLSSQEYDVLRTYLLFG